VLAALLLELNWQGGQAQSREKAQEALSQESLRFLPE
jgi:hypothetical protein